MTVLQTSEAERHRSVRRCHARALSRSIIAFLSEAVRDADVLDVGCADHRAENESDPRWLHKHIVRSARSVVGLELVESEAAKLRARGYNVVTGDAVTAELGRTFDVIVAGELIEHIDNPGGFIRNMRRHLNANGRLIITTPNPFFVWHWLEWSLMSSKLRERWNLEHVGWQDPFTLQNLLERCGMMTEATYYFSRSRKTSAVLGVLHMACPRSLASSFVTVARAS